MALGENATVGGWAGAGTNGGASLAIVHMSWGLVPFFPVSEWIHLFAGVQMYAGMMPTYGDTMDAATFGHAIAAPYTASGGFSTLSTDFVNAIASVTDGGGCGAGQSGGGFGYCGCHVIMTCSDSVGDARNIINEPWSAVKFTNGTQTSAAICITTYGCNYNFNTYPWSGGY